MDPETWVISDAVAELHEDPWREANPFSEDMLQCHEVVLDPSRSRSEKAESLAKWLADFQPCLFGRMEARRDRLAFCMLTDNDLEQSDQKIRRIIQRDRQDWRRTASAGDSHGFLIAAISQRISTARADSRLQKLASALCGLYLGAGDFDHIHLDELLLKVTNDREWRRWKVGVNYFSAQADGRWWSDHRIPGGMVFSMNSVGHMARTQVERKLRAQPEIAAKLDDVVRDKLVYWALRKAMETISPFIAGSSRGTWLTDRGTFPEDSDSPSFKKREQIFGNLAHYSENRYKGLYHTDETIPTVYFDESRSRREHVVERDDLFFTYLHSVMDRDYEIMGIGQALGLGEVAEDSLGSER